MRRFTKKKLGETAIGIALSAFAAAMVLMPAMNVYADTYDNIRGTVNETDDDNTVILDTGNGLMAIKLDEGTDATGCKVLVKGVDVVMNLHNGGDGFLHASRIYDVKDYSDATVDKNKQSTVVGLVSNQTTKDRLFITLNNSGMVSIKMDNSTDFTNCQFLIPHKYVSVVTAPGSDGFLHALKVSDLGKSTANANTTSTTATTGQVTVTGTVANGTDSSHLYLTATEGTYTIILDNNTDKSGVGSLTVGKTVSASIYRGSDAYMHAAKVWTGSASSSAASTATTTYSVTGTIAKDSNTTYLYLSTSGSTYKFKVDSYSTPITVGKNVKVTFYNPGDGILHAATVVEAK